MSQYRPTSDITAKETSTPLAPWRSRLARALHRNRSLANARYLQLATLGADRRPANRTIVFRGFLEASNQLKFVTDLRSAKAEQVIQSPWSEACWYFPKTREQFRISGQLVLIDRDCSDPILQQQRQLMWQSLSSAAREQFTGAPPGVPKEKTWQTHTPDPNQPEKVFGLLLLHPHQIDHLELRGVPQQRHLYTRGTSDSWIVQQVNP